MSEKNSFLVFSGTKTRYLAEKICASLGCPLGNLVITRFSDGEAMRSRFAVVTFSWCRAPFRILTTLWSCC